MTRDDTGYDLPHIDFGGGGGSGWAVLARARDDIDAQLLVGLLAESGIETRVVKDPRAPGAWLYGGSNPWAPSAVMVRAIQLEDARFVLVEISFDAPAVEPTFEAPPSGRRHSLTWWLTAVGLGAIMTALALAAPEGAGHECRSASSCPDDITGK